MADAAESDLGFETIKGSAAKAFLAVVGFAGTVAFANLLGRTSFGAYYLLLSVVQIVERPASGGIVEAGQKRASEAGGDEVRVLGGMAALVGGWVALAVVGAFVLSSELRSYTELPQAAPLFAVLLVSLATFHVFMGLLNARGAVGRATWVDALRSLLTVVGQLGLVLLGWGVVGMAVGFTLATALTAVGLGISLAVRPGRPDRSTVRSLLAYAKYSTPTSLLWKTFDRFDVLLLGFLVGTGAVADYEIAFKLTVPALLVSQSLGTGLMVRGSALSSADDDETFTRDISNGLGFASLLSIPILFGALVVARPLVVTVYGAEYASAAPLLVGLCLFRVLSTQAGPLSKSIRGLDRPDLALRLAAVGLFVNVVVGVPLTLWVGAVGVVIATVVSEAIRYVGYLVVVRRLLPDVDLFPRPIVEQLGAATVMAVATFGVTRVVDPQGVIGLGVALCVGAGVYGGVLLGAGRRHRHTVGALLARSSLADRLPVPLRRWLVD